jgi:protein-tyrosine sulfotransferase
VASQTTQQILRYAARPWEIAINLGYWRRARHSDLPIVFVLGPPRSGTTLIHRTLLNHAALQGFPAETSIFSPKSLLDFDRFSGFLGRPTFDRALSETDDVVSFFAAMHRLTFPFHVGPGLWFVEKTPQHVKRLSFLLDHFDNARVLHVIRDGRDAFCSGRSTGNIPQAARLSNYASYWMTCVRARTAVNSDRVLDVRYEGFTADPELELQRMMGFIGLEADPEVQLSSAQRAQDQRAASHKFSRLSQDISTKTVGRWRTEMTPEEQALFTRIAGDGLSRFGYLQS